VLGFTGPSPASFRPPPRPSPASFSSGVLAGRAASPAPMTAPPGPAPTAAPPYPEITAAPPGLWATPALLGLAAPPSLAATPAPLAAICGVQGSIPLDMRCSRLDPLAAI